MSDDAKDEVRDSDLNMPERPEQPELVEVVMTVKVGSVKGQEVLSFHVCTITSLQAPSTSSSLFTSCISEPKFVTSWLDPFDRKLYFFFSEVGKEFSFVNKLRIARVAQVCKVIVAMCEHEMLMLTVQHTSADGMLCLQDDVGGQRTLQKKWTSFAKAPLLCQAPNQLPFNELQDLFTLQPAEGDNDTNILFYGIFTSQWYNPSVEPVFCGL